MAPDEFRNALLKLVDDYVETPADAADAIAALYDRADSLERWKTERGAEQS